MMNPSAALSALPEVVVVGEALIDVVHTGNGVTEHPGGSPANVAYGLARLDVSTGFLTSIGTDSRGVAIAAISAVQVSISSPYRSRAATSTATATLADDGAATYTFDLAWELPPVAPTYLPTLLHAGSIASFLAPGAAGVKSLSSTAQEPAPSPMTPTSNQNCSAAKAALVLGCSPRRRGPGSARS